MISNTKSKPLRILLVEDSEHDLIAFRKALQKGCTPVDLSHYVRAEDAFDRLMVDASWFDLIVTDYKLPGMSGLDLCRALIDNDISLPIVLLVGTDKNGLATAALTIGVDDYLIKDPDQGYLNKLPIILLDAVRKHANRQASKHPDKGYVISKAHYPIIIEDQTEFIRCFSLNGTLTYVNKAYCDLLNETEDQLMGQPFLQYVPIEEHDKIKKHIASLSRQNPIKTIKHSVRSPDGKTQWQEWTDRAILNSQGQIIGYQSIGRDISEKKRALETLFQSQERYRSIIELIPNGFFVCDITTGDFLLINQQACDLLQHPMQEVLTFSLWDMISPEDTEKLKDHIQAQSMEDITRLPIETYTFQPKNGKTINVEISSSIVILDGKRVLQGIIQETK